MLAFKIIATIISFLAIVAALYKLKDKHDLYEIIYVIVVSLGSIYVVWRFI